MALERATEAARKGDLATLEAFPPEQLRKATSTLDEDGRSRPFFLRLGLCCSADTLCAVTTAATDTQQDQQMLESRLNTLADTHV